MNIVYRLSKWAIACIALCVSACYSQTKGKMEERISLTTHEKSVGIGRLRVGLNSDIPLYHSETGLVVDTIRFSNIKSGRDKGKLVIASKIFLYPIEWNLGESERESKARIKFGLAPIGPILAFKVLRCTEDGYEVVVNEDSFETAIIKNDSIELGEDWFLYET